MPRPNVLVIAVDGLRANALGAYGNTWYPTPILDRLASQSVLCDWCFADATELSLIYRSLWQAVSGLRPPMPMEPGWSLPKMLVERGYQARLITDARDLTKLPGSQQFTEGILIDQKTTAVARGFEQSSIAFVLAEVLDFLEAEERRKSQPWFLWTHLSGGYGAWDAPIELALSLIEEGDATPENLALPPDKIVDRDFQADTIYAESCRYAAQVMMLDTLLEPLCERLDDDATGECIVILVGTRGFPLGEHGQLGGVDGRLYSEQLHVPMLIRLPQQLKALTRISQLVQPTDLPATILGALDLDDACGDGLDLTKLLAGQKTPWRSSLMATGIDRTLSIRTPAWYLRGPDQLTGDSAELFVKPDDRWEANDVASLCSEVVAELAEIAVAERTRISAGESPSMVRLPVELIAPNH